MNALAGKETYVSKPIAYVVAAMVGGGSLAMALVTTHLKLRRQKAELVRLRKRLLELERALQDALNGKTN